MVATDCLHADSLIKDTRCCVDCGQQLRAWYTHEWVYWEVLQPLWRVWSMAWWGWRCTLGLHHRGGHYCGMCRQELEKS